MQIFLQHSKEHPAILFASTYFVDYIIIILGTVHFGKIMELGK